MHDLEALVWAAPVAFLLGVLVGLGAASRWRITRRPQPPPDQDHV